jgi:hypothetical protein
MHNARDPLKKRQGVAAFLLVPAAGIHYVAAPMRSAALVGLLTAFVARLGLAQQLPPSFAYDSALLADAATAGAPASGSRAQSSSPHRSTFRLMVVGGVQIAGLGFAYREAQQTWGVSAGRFHVKNDWTGDTLSQSDEISHLFFGYTLTRVFSRMWRWGGLSAESARSVGAVESALTLTLVEVMDAYNPTQGLGTSDLLFDYAGVGAGLLSLHHPGNWGIRASTKRADVAKPFSLTKDQYDDWIFWATYRPPLRWGAKQPLSFGLGHSTRRAPDGLAAVRELHFGIGTTLPDIVRVFSPRIAQHVEILDFYYINLNLTATVH